MNSPDQRLPGNGGNHAIETTASAMAAETRSSFWLLAAFFGVLFFVGGSSWGNEAGLVVLRPLAIVFLGIGLARFRKDRFYQFWAVLCLFGATVCLVVAHLIPLPPDVWHQLPGRKLLLQIDQIAGLGDINRPLSLSPEATLNALYSLAVPAAVLTNAVHLKLEDQMRLMMLLLCFVLASALLSVAQAAGSDIAFYGFTSATPGIFANRNHQSALIAIGFPILAACSYFAARNEMINHKLANGFALAVGLALIPLILVIGSRAGLALSIVAVLMIPFVVGNDSPRRATHARLGITALKWVGSFLSVGVMMWLTFAASRDVVFMRLTDENEEGRYSLWSRVAAGLPEWMPWGSGIGSFADTYQISESSWVLGPKFLNHAHNDWLEVVYTAGLPGAVLLLAACGVLFASAWRSRRLNGRAAVLARTGALIMFLLALASISDYPVRTPIMASILALAAVWAYFPQEVRK